MGEIKLNIDDSMRILNSADTGPNERVIAASAVAFFEANKAVGELDPETKTIAHKLLRMTASALDETDDD